MSLKEPLEETVQSIRRRHQEFVASTSTSDPARYAAIQGFDNDLKRAHLELEWEVHPTAEPPVFRRVLNFVEECRGFFFDLLPEEERYRFVEKGPISEANQVIDKLAGHLRFVEYYQSSEANRGTRDATIVTEEERIFYERGLDMKEAVKGLISTFVKSLSRQL